jgi:hypothetical protein
LGHIDVIPDQYSRYRSIIDRYVDTNDGYLVLYEMLEDEHPAMQQDPIQRPPTSNECQDDIQEYSARFTSYLMSEHLNGRTYRTREQVVLFLKGLDTEFAPAVQYVETLRWTKPQMRVTIPTPHHRSLHEAVIFLQNYSRQWNLWLL